MREDLETPRLHMAPFAADDAAVACAWFRDPAVMRFIPTGPDGSLEATRTRLDRYREHQARHGFSRWIVRERASRQPIGDAGLIVLDDAGTIDLGFRFARAFWGQGYATEAASAWTRAAFVDFHLDRLTAFVHPENVASLRVLGKVHFRVTGRDRVMGMASIILALDAAAFHRSAGFSAR